MQNTIKSFSSHRKGSNFSLVVKGNVHIYARYNQDMYMSNAVLTMQNKGTLK